MNSGNRVLIALLAGAAAGVILGVLFAPMSGEEMRENISTKAADISDKVKKKAEEGMNYAKNLKSKASGKINEMLNNEKEEQADLT